MSTFTIKAVETDSEYIAAQALMSLAFGGSVDTERIIASMGYAHQRPAYQRDQHRIGILDGEVVAHAIALSCTLCYGEVELTFGGIGGVCSHPDQRLKGYVAAVMRDAIQYMQGRGDHLSLLNTGAVNFYTKFGYHTLWSDASVEIETSDALTLNSKLTARSAVAADAPQMSALFDRIMAQRVTVNRSPATWAWRMANQSIQHRRVVEDNTGQIVGYLVGLHGNSQLELVSESDEAIAILLADSARIFQDGGPDALSILVTPDDRLLHRIRRMVPCEMNMECVPGSNWMARMIDLDGFRKSILPELLRQSGLDLNTLILNIQPNSVYLGLRGQDSTNVELDHGTFLQVLFGLLPPAVLPLHEDAIHLLERLCPRRDFVINPWDWF